ncbi:uncharacterized protein [Temnothorax nylanderi]|uniref:uncharacterized protein n=1 Tax=Temnothorax nylanderi TaxID=102681 RepID=UPI003A8C8758
MVQTLIKQLRKVNLRKTNLSQPSSSSGLHIVASIPILPEADDLRLKRSLEFLKVQLEPWEEVKECWEYTSSFRLSQLRDRGNKDLKVADYINKYPVLRQPGGYILLEYDFQVLFKGAENRMLTHWSQFSAKVERELINIGVREESLDCEAALLFNYLKLLSVVPVKVPKRKPWRASKAEIQEGFLVHLKVIGDLEKQLEGMKKTVQTKGTELQLFPVIVGEDLKNITSSYVVLDDRPIRVESPVRAIEVAFKAYHALHCNYPVQSERLWVVIEKALYRIEHQWKSSVETAPEVKRLIALLKCD